MSTYILVHGFWIGGWAWDRVRAQLEAAGHRVLAPSLPGNEGRDDDRSRIGLQTHVDFITGLVDGEEGQVILVGHSAGSAVVHAVVDRRPDRVATAVYVDTRPLPDGVALNPALAGDGDEVPMRPIDDFAEGWLADLDEQELDEFVRRGVPSPAGAARDLQRLADPRRYEVPVLIIPTTTTEAAMRALAEQGDPYFTELPLIKQLSFVELPTSHYPMLSRPSELAQVLLGVATTG